MIYFHIILILSLKAMNQLVCWVLIMVKKKKKQKEQKILQFIMQLAFKTSGGLTLPNTPHSPLSFT